MVDLNYIGSWEQWLCLAELLQVELRNEAKYLCFLYPLVRSVCYLWMFIINLIIHRIVAKTSLTSPPWPEVKLPNPVEEAKHHAGKGVKSPSEA